MSRKLPSISSAVAVFAMVLAGWGTKALVSPPMPHTMQAPDTAISVSDTAIPLPFPFHDETWDPTDKESLGG